MSNTTAGSNSAPVDKAIADQCYEFGKQEGYGQTARHRFVDWICARAKEGEASVDRAAEYWAKYATGAKDIAVEEFKEGELEQRASDLKHFITLGANTLLDGPELLDNARLLLRVMRTNGTAKGARTWDTVLVWARKQNRSNERALTDPEVEDLFRAQAKKGTDELDRLTGVQNILQKQVKIYEDERALRDEQREQDEAAGTTTTDPEDDQPEGVAGIYTALELVQNRLAELGGTRKEQRKQERARIRAEKKAAKAAATAGAP
jgi:hypothetical protein